MDGCVHVRTVYYQALFLPAHQDCGYEASPVDSPMVPNTLSPPPCAFPISSPTVPNTLSPPPCAFPINSPTYTVKMVKGWLLKF